MKVIFVLIIAIQLTNLSFGLNGLESNVCKSLFYPKDPDFDKSVCELVVSAGFQCETHEVTTKDGYILPQFRIVNPALTTVGKPVLLVHGLLANAAFLIMNSPGIGTEFSKDTFNGQTVSRNLGYALAMNGYDVWLVSYRGDQYSMKHKTLSSKSRKFWQYSTDEHIAYDLPAIIDFVVTQNNNTKISYVGHSQGTTILFGLLASFPKYNDIIDIGVALAPVVILRHSPSIVVQTATIPPTPQLLYLKGGPLGFGYKTNSELLSTVAFNCPLFNALLPIMNLLAFGPSKHLNKSRAHVYFKNLGGDSWWAASRYVQHPNSFRHFDYGPAKNLEKYKSLLPPQYDITKIKSHICLISGTNDYLGDQKDMEFIRKRLNKNVLVGDLVYPGLNHVDLALPPMTSNINFKILELFAKYK